MRKLLFTSLTTVALWAAGAANAAQVVFDFDDLASFVEVPGSYGGASWSGFSTAASSGGTSLPNIAFTSASTGILDYAPGFTSLTFSAGVFAPGTFAVYDGIGGAGTLLGSLTIDNLPADPDAFFLTGVSFSGVGKSVVVTGGVGQIGWDDVTLTIDENAVPEPMSLALAITAFGLIGLGSRRRRLAVAD